MAPKTVAPKAVAPPKAAAAKAAAGDANAKAGDAKVTPEVAKAAEAKDATTSEKPDITSTVVALRPEKDEKTVEPYTAIELWKEGAGAAANGTEESKDIKPKAKKRREKSGVLFTIGHPPDWDLGELLKVLERYAVQSVVDARPTPEKGPTSAAVAVACSTSSIVYERQSLLSNVYCKLADQVTGTSTIDASTPVVLLSGELPWRVEQQRRCITSAMKTKSLEVHHLSWNGDVDKEAALKCSKIPNRADHKYPKAAAYVKPTKPVPKQAVLQSKPKGGGAAPSTGAAAPIDAAAAMPGGVLPSKPKSAPEASAPSVLPSRAKGAPSKPASAAAEDSSDAAAQSDLLKPKPKQAATLPRPSPPREAPPAEAPEVAAPKSERDNMWGLLGSSQKPVEQPMKASAKGAPPSSAEPAKATVLKPAAKGAPSAKVAAQIPMKPTAKVAASKDEPTVMRPSAKGGPSAKQAAPVLRASAKGGPGPSAAKRVAPEGDDGEEGFVENPPKRSTLDIT